MKVIFRFISLTALLLIAVIKPSSAQWMADTSHEAYPSSQIENFLKGNHPAFYTGVEISVFGNEDCGHCKHLKELFAADSIPYILYDVNKNREYYNLMLELVDKVDKGNRSFYYPVVLVNDSIYYSIFRMEDFVNNLRKEYFGYRED